MQAVNIKSKSTTMKQEQEELVFDESQAIKFILDYLPKEDSEKLTEDDIQFVLDAIYDFYESEGLIDDETETEAEVEETDVDESEMLEFVREQAKKENISLTDEQLQLILAGEFAYGVSIGIYQEED